VRELAYLNKYLLRYKYQILLGILFVAISHLFSILPARLIKNTFDFLHNNVSNYQVEIAKGVTLEHTRITKIFRGLISFIMLIVSMSIIKAIHAFLIRFIIIYTANKIEYALKNELYSQYQILPISFYRQFSTGDLMARITEDMSKVKHYLGPAILFTLHTVVLCFMLIPYMLTIHVTLTFYALFPILILGISTYYIKKILYQRSKKLQNTLSKLITFTQESFSGIRLIQAFVKENNFSNNFFYLCKKYKKNALSLTAINALFVPLSIGINNLGIILVTLIGSYEVMKGNMTLGMIAEFMVYMHLFTWPIVSISMIFTFIQKAAASQKRINAILKEKIPIISSKNIQHNIKGKIYFEKISFTYPKANNPTINELSLGIKAGKFVAILGSTGIGKSTLAKLLMLLYSVDKGTIYLDDIPIQDYKLTDLRNQLAYVPQETFLFPDTIINNIIFGNPNATAEHIQQVIEASGLLDMVKKLPHGLKTMLGERGITLSGGQKQRIAIARALIRQPALLLLDDSFSALDNYTAQYIFNNIIQIMYQKTIVFFTNKTDNLHMVDEILLLVEGRLAEQGTHETLLSKKGLYAKLYEENQIENDVFANFM